MARQRLLPILIIILSSGCDVSDRPLADATDLFERAVGLFEEKSYQQAESLFVQALPTFEQMEQTYTVAEVNKYLGEIYFAEGRLYSALGKFTVAQDQARRANDFRKEMMLHRLVGDAYAALGSYQDALMSYAAAHKLSAAFNDGDTKAGLEMSMGKVSFFAEKLDDAMWNYQSALGFYQAGGGGRAAEALHGIGEVRLRQKMYDEALSSFSQARVLLEKSDEPLLDAQLRMNIGYVHKAQGNFNDALQWFRDAANNLRSKKVGREHEVLLLFNIGMIYFDNGRFADAKKYFSEAAGVARALGDGIAEGYLELCLARCDERLLPPPQRIQGTEKLAQTYQGIGQKFQASGHHTGEAYAYARVAGLYESVGNLVKAREYYQKAVSLEEETLGEYLQPEFHRVYQEHLKVADEWMNWYAQLASVLLQAKSKEEALTVLERYSSKGLFDLLQNVEVIVRHPEIKEQVSKARSRLRELRMLQIEHSSLLSMRRSTNNDHVVSRLQTQIENLRKEVTALSTRIINLYPNYEPLLRVSAIKLQELQASIPPGTLVVRFLPASDQLHVFAMTRTKFEVKSAIVTREKLLALVEEYKRLLHDPSVYTGIGGEASVPVMTRFATLSTQLYDYLLRPVDALLERNLVIIMSPEFENLPFHAIERQDRQGTVKYLVEITSVDYLPSLSSLRFKTAAAPRLNQVVAVGNPTGKNWSIDYELRDIRSFFKEATILISIDATWDNVKEAKADMLQLSTDFTMGEGTSVLGMIALAKPQSPEEVTKVPFEKLAELRAPSIIILSNQYGQGFGLSPAHAMLLRINGTSDLFLNAWFSDRKAAKFFSEFFYTHLANGLAPGDAYRQALLNLIRTRDVNHPHSWGQFFHYGVG
ncbi:MAG: tetratricopeptide repeat protein [Bacteroidota bacterium]|mgnify:FL=1